MRNLHLRNVIICLITLLLATMHAQVSMAEPVAGHIEIKGVGIGIDWERLDLSGMELTSADIEPLRYMTNLEELALTDNQISDISVLNGLTTLTDLDLGYNQISDISALSGLMSLSGADFSSNQISDIGGLNGLTNLLLLAMEDNPISDWSPVDHVEDVWGRP